MRTSSFHFPQLYTPTYNMTFIDIMLNVLNNLYIEANVIGFYEQQNDAK